MGLVGSGRGGAKLLFADVGVSITVFVLCVFFFALSFVLQHFVPFLTLSAFGQFFPGVKIKFNKCKTSQVVVAPEEVWPHVCLLPCSHFMSAIRVT